MPNTVKLKNYSDIMVEYTASEAISPGMLVEPVPSAATIRKHATESGNAIPMFAVENELEGEGITTAYASGDKLQVWIPGRGDVVYAQVEDEQNIAIGNFLESNGAGYLQVHIAPSADSAQDDISYTGQIIGQALEALDLTSLSAAGSSDTPARQFLRVRIM